MEPWMKKCCLTYFVFTVETFLFIVDSFFRIGFNMSVACFCKSVTSRSPPRLDPGHLRTRVSIFTEVSRWALLKYIYIFVALP